MHVCEENTCATKFRDGKKPTAACQRKYYLRCFNLKAEIYDYLQAAQENNLPFPLSADSSIRFICPTCLQKPKLNDSNNATKLKTDKQVSLTKDIQLTVKSIERAVDAINTTLAEQQQTLTDTITSIHQLGSSSLTVDDHFPRLSTAIDEAKRKIIETINGAVKQIPAVVPQHINTQPQTILVNSTSAKVPTPIIGSAIVPRTPILSQKRKHSSLNTNGNVTKTATAPMNAQPTEQQQQQRFTRPQNDSAAQYYQTQHQTHQSIASASLLSTTPSLAHNIDLPQIVPRNQPNTNLVNVQPTRQIPPKRMFERQIYMSAFSPNATNQQIINFIELHSQLQFRSHFAIKRLIGRNYSTTTLSFISVKVFVAEECFQQMLNPANWPPNMVVREFSPQKIDENVILRNHYQQQQPPTLNVQQPTNIQPTTQGTLHTSPNHPAKVQRVINNANTAQIQATQHQNASNMSTSSHTSVLNSTMNDITSPLTMMSEQEKIYLEQQQQQLLNLMPQSNQQHQHTAPSQNFTA